MPCDSCKASPDLPSGWMGECQSCGEFRWYPGNGNELFLVPGFRAGKLPIVPVQDEREAIIKDLTKPKRTRLVSKYRYGDKAKMELDHIEYLLGLRRPRVRGWGKRLDVFRKHVRKFGLDLTQLVPGSKVKDSEPLLLHWLGVDPFMAFPTMQACPDPAVKPYSAEDANYPSYHLQMNLHEHLFGDPFRPHQRKAIEQILKHSGSRQIIALPTGYGKTRIVQTVTNVLRSHDKGPALMITPIIALRDDQREAFETDFRDNAKSFGKEFRGRFITAAGGDQDEIIDELINDELDLLCCAPEHLLNPSQNMSWIEVFRRMKKPFSTLVVDEAHVVGDWGSSFRSHFLLLGQLKDRLVEMNQELRVVLQSATITKHEELELKGLFDELLDLPEVRAFDTREDLHFRIDLEEPEALEGIRRKTIDYESNTKAVVRDYRDAPGLWLSPWDDQNDTGRAPLLIYSAIKKDAEERIRPVLEEEFGGGNVETYTGDTDESKRDRLRIRFKTNKMDAMVATAAFGMGIDKPDVWMIAYLGLPFTLKGLYQGFGRAARGSNWDHHRPDKPVRNGCCLATLPKENPNQTRQFRPDLRIELAAERLWDLMMSEQTAHIQDKGYLVAPVLEGLHSPLWRQTDKQVSDYVKATPTEAPDEEDEDYDTTGLTTRSQEDAWLQAERSFDLGRRSTYLKNLKYRMWSLACLQRKRGVSILGFYPKTLYIDTSDGSSVELEEALRLGGHQEAIGALKRIDESPSIGTPQGQPRLAVIRFNQPVNSWAGILKALEEGHDDLRERHQRGNQELKEFMDDVGNGLCLRRALAPAIGASKKRSKDCIQLLREWRDSDTGEREPPVPCHSCLPNLPCTLSTRGGSSPLWLDEGNLRLLRGEPEPEPDPPDPLDPTWDNVPLPVYIVTPKLDENENPEWIIPGPPPSEFYNDDASLVEIDTVRSGADLKLDNPPPRSGALAFYRVGKSLIARFVDERITHELLEEWKRDGAEVVN